MKRIITQADKDAFLEFYFGWRAEGKNIRECYRLARQAYIAEGHDSVPSFSTLRRWLYPNMSKKVKKTADAESEEAGRKDMTADAESEEAGRKDMTAVAESEEAGRENMTAVAEIAACGNEDPGNEAEGGLEEEQNNNEVYAKSIAAAATDRSEIYRALLRAYRLRREEDIDGLVDLIAPEVTA